MCQFGNKVLFNPKLPGQKVREPRSVAASVSARDIQRGPWNRLCRATGTVPLGGKREATQGGDDHPPM